MNELEELRKEALSNTPNKQDTLHELLQLAKGIHTAWLFHPWGQPALVSLCESLSSLSARSNGSWYNFAGVLGLPFEKIECIFNDLSGRDKSQLCLMTFAQYNSSTLDRIISVLGEVERFDALTKVQPLITNLVKTIKSQIGHQKWENSQSNETAVDRHGSEFASIQDEDRSRGSNTTRINVIIRPKGYTRLKLHLPITLQASPTDDIRSLSSEIQVVAKTLGTSKSSIKENAVYQQSVSTAASVQGTESCCNELPQPVPFKKVVFLTFSCDGEQAAYRIASALRNPSSKRSPFGVLILDENAEELHRNPEMQITNLFHQVNYVMPIITEGYLESLKSGTNSASAVDMLSSLDDCYVQYIHDLMRKYYIRNSCRNDKFRCIIPNMGGDNATYLRSILSNQIFNTEPTLRAWTYESNLEQLAQRLTT